MDQKVIQRRLTVCGEISVYEEEITEPVYVSNPNVPPLPASMADKCAATLRGYVGDVLRNDCAGNKQTISTIKAIRALTGCGLREAKDAYERSWAR